MLKQCLSLSWGPSFAELQTPKLGVRSLATQIHPGQLLKAQIATHPDLQKARMSMSVTRRILNTRLGNSVAQIVTKGFEHWVELRQDADPQYFDLSPSRRDPLANSENIFSVQERISSQGEIALPLNLQELASIAETLKKKQITRVCLNFLNSHQNPSHQEQARKFLNENGFRVFSQERTKNKEGDELSAWRRNLLDAGLASFVEKSIQDLSEACPELSFEFLDTEKGFCSQDSLSNSGLLFGRELALQREKPFVYFGAEDWGWVLPQKTNSWKSPWGHIQLEHPEHGFFRLQPGQELILNSFGQIRWGTDLGLDPGPVMWGRSSKLTLLDFLGWQLQTEPALRRNEKSELKVQDLYSAFKKNSKDWSSLSFDQARQDVFEALIESLLIDLSANLQCDDFIIGGVWAAEILPLIKKRKPKWKISLNSSANLETENFWNKL